jgi:hypothetical protein
MLFLTLESYLVSLLSVFRATPHIMLPALHESISNPEAIGHVNASTINTKDPKDAIRQ